MGDWRKVCTGLTVILLVLILYLGLFGSPLTAWQLERQVKQHLTELGVDESEILSTDAVYQRNNQAGYMIQVVFTAEPEIVHYYYRNVDKEIQEMEYVNV